MSSIDITIVWGFVGGLFLLAGIARFCFGFELWTGAVASFIGIIIITVAFYLSPNENPEQSESCGGVINHEKERYLINPCEGYEYYEYIIDGDTIMSPSSLTYVYDRDFMTNILVIGHKGEVQERLIDTSFIAKKSSLIKGQ